MPDTKPIEPVAPIDRLNDRNDPEPLPTKLEPASPEARGYPADPRPVPRKGQADPRATNPPPDDIGRPA
jgi:hypothetical protein